MKQIDTIEVTNQEIFGDNETHSIEMEFCDGYAISVDNQFGMSYPTLELINNNDNLCEKVYEYCGRGADEPFDSALTFGVLFKLPALDDWAEKRHDILMDLLTDNQLEVYERKCFEMENTNKRDFFVVELDAISDCGMKVTHVPDANGLEDCKIVAFDTRLIPSDATLLGDQDGLDAINECDFDELLEVHEVFKDKGQFATSYYYVVSKPCDANRYIGMVWCRRGCSMENKTAVLFFATKEELDKYVTDCKVSEFKSDLETLGITWNLEIMEGDGGNAVCCGIQAIDNGIPNFNIWGNDGYNVHIVNGRY